MKLWKYGICLLTAACLLSGCTGKEEPDSAAEEPVRPDYYVGVEEANAPTYTEAESKLNAPDKSGLLLVPNIWIFPSIEPLNEAILSGIKGVIISNGNPDIDKTPFILSRIPSL